MQNFIAKLSNKNNVIDEQESTVCLEDFIGKKYSRWTVIKDTGKRGKNRERYVLCRCECGTEKEVLLRTLTKKSSKSCGCYRIDQMNKRKPANFKHGWNRTPECQAWNSMVSRCTNKENKDWKYYGGRGISVCEEWLDREKGFQRFLAHIGEKPEPKNRYSLDRIDNSGNYEQGNVRWAKRNIQVLNRRRRMMLEDHTTEELINEIERRGYHVKTTK